MNEFLKIGYRTDSAYPNKEINIQCVAGLNIALLRAGSEFEVIEGVPLEAVMSEMLSKDRDTKQIN